MLNWIAWNWSIRYLTVCKQKTYSYETELFEIEVFIYKKNGRGFNKQQWVMSHETKPRMHWVDFSTYVWTMNYYSLVDLIQNDSHDRIGSEWYRSEFW